MLGWCKLGSVREAKRTDLNLHLPNNLSGRVNGNLWRLSAAKGTVACCEGPRQFILT